MYYNYFIPFLIKKVLRLFYKIRMLITFSVSMSKVYISFVPAIPFLRMHNKETFVQEVSAYARIFPTALFAVSKD